MKTKQVIKYHLKEEFKKALKGIGLALIVVVAVIAITPILNANAQADEKAMNYCMEKNNNYSYCINGLRG